MNAIVIFLGRPSARAFRDRSLFTAWGGEEIRGDHFIFGRTKGEISPKGGSLKTLEGFKGGPLKFAWKIKTCGEGGGSRKSSKVIRGDHFSEVTFKAGIG